MALFTKIGGILGGLGLFLLAVTMITEGLKFAAAQTLRDILGRWTSTPLRGAVLGIGMGALAQSGSTVAILAMGLVNSGLLSLLRALGPIYGANVGSTVTGWLIALSGYTPAFSGLVWPLVGFGILIRTFSRNSRVGAVGDALAGLGLLFVALDIIRASFVDITAAIPISLLANGGLAGILLSVTIGLALAALVHSGGALALIMSAAIAGVIPLPNAFAALIGINIGAIGPALLPVLQGTPMAKRIALSYLIVNLAAASIMAVLYPPIAWSIRDSVIADRLTAHPALALAAFHTVFNVAGMAALGLVTERFAVWLERRFRTVDEDEGKPRFLDKAVIATPEIGIDAAARELGRMGEIARKSAVSALREGREELVRIKVRRNAVRSLAVAIDEFARALRRRTLSPATGDALPTVLRVVQYYEEVAVLAERALSSRLALESRMLPVLAVLRQVYTSAARTMVGADPTQADFLPDKSAAEFVEFLALYQNSKATLLRAGIGEDLAVSDLSACLDQISRVRRMVEQVVKAARHLYGLKSRLSSRADSADSAAASQPNERTAQ